MSLRTKISTITTYIRHFTRVLANAISQEKEIEEDWKGSHKAVIFSQMTNIKEPNNPLLELISKFRKVTSNKVNIKHQLYFSILATLKNKILKIPLTNNVCVCMCLCVGVREEGQ